MVTSLILACNVSAVEVVDKPIASFMKKVDVKIKCPQLKGLKDKKIERAMNKLLLDDCQGIINKQKLLKEPNHQTLSGGYKVFLNKDNLLSLTIAYEGYMEHAAHPWHLIVGYNYDLTSGKMIKFNDLFVKDYKAKLNKLVNKALTDKIKGYELEFKTVKDDQDFYLTDDSLVVFFNEYEIGPYVIGAPEAKIAYKDIKDIMDPKGPVFKLGK